MSPKINPFLRIYLVLFLGGMGRNHPFVGFISPRASPPLPKRQYLMMHFMKIFIWCLYDNLPICSSAGPVNFAIRAANVPGANGDISIGPQNHKRRHSRIFRRGLGSIISGAGSAVAGAVHGK